MRLDKKRILIVDDDPQVRSSISRYLTHREYDVSVASGGEEALRMIAEDPPHLVLLDVLMPQMDGVEALDEIRKRFPKVDVVMISALQDEGVARKTVEMGAYEWIPKPFSLEQLELAVFTTLLCRGKFSQNGEVSIS